MKQTVTFYPFTLIFIDVFCSDFPVECHRALFQKIYYQQFST